jgi:type II secretory pathway component PulF
MSAFEYTGTDAQGQVRHGKVEAPALAAAAEKVRELGLLSLCLRRQDAVPARAEGGADAFAYFNRALADMLRAGIPLPAAVGEIARSIRGGRLAGGLSRVEAALREGRRLDEAVAAAGFPAAYVAMVRAGTASGNLPGVLAAVARSGEGVHRLRGALAHALSYPAMVLVIGAAIAIALLVFGLPYYEDLYRIARMEPTLGIRLASWVSGSPGTAALAGLLPLVGLAAAAWALLRSEAGERLLGRVPVLGPILGGLAGVRFLSCLATLLRAKAPLADALPVALAASGSRRLARQAEGARAAALEGAGLARALDRLDGLPPATGAILELAERAGCVPDAAEELAAFLVEQAAAETETLGAVAFPTAIVAIGLALTAAIVTIVWPHIHFVEQMAGPW